jgi:hypothetical protein
MLSTVEPLFSDLCDEFTVADQRGPPIMTDVNA